VEFGRGSYRKQWASESSVQSSVSVSFPGCGRLIYIYIAKTLLSRTAAALHASVGVAHVVDGSTGFW
jgi:hypothetical protein